MAIIRSIMRYCGVVIAIVYLAACQHNVSGVSTSSQESAQETAKPEAISGLQPNGCFRMVDNSVDVCLPMVVHTDVGVFKIVAESFDQKTMMIDYVHYVKGKKRSTYTFDVDAVKTVHTWYDYYKKDILKDYKFSDYLIRFTKNDRGALYKGIYTIEDRDTVVCKVAHVDLRYADRFIAMEVFFSGWTKDYAVAKSYYKDEVVFGHNNQLSKNKDRNIMTEAVEALSIGIQSSIQVKPLLMPSSFASKFDGAAPTIPGESDDKVADAYSF